MSPKRRSTVRRWIVPLASVVLAFLVLAGAGVAYMLGTERGARWTLGALHRLGVQVEEVQGRLLGPLELRGLSYQSEDLDLQVGRVALDWRPWALRTRTLAVEALEVEDPILTLGAAAEDGLGDAPTELPDFSLPVAVDLHGFEVRNLVVRRSDEQLLHVSEILGSLEARDADIVLRRLEVGHEMFDLQVQGMVETRDGYPVDLSFDWHGSFPDVPELEGGGTLAERVSNLHLQYTHTAPSGAELEAEVSGLPGPPEWRGRFHTERADLDPFLPDGPLEWASLSGEGSGSAADADFRLSFQSGGEEVGRLSGAVEGRTEDGTVQLQRLETLGELTAATVTADGAGAFRWADRGWGELALDWSVALPDTPPLSGRVQASGTLERIDLENHLDAPVAAHLQASLADPTAELNWQARLEAPPFILARLGDDLPEHEVAFSLGASGDRGSFDGEAAMRGWLATWEEDLPTVEADLRFAGDLDARRGTVNELLLRSAPGGLARARGAVDLSEPEPRFQVEAEWDGLEWPGSGDGPSLKSRSGTLTVEGGPSGYGTWADLALEVDAPPELHLLLEGEGTEQAFQLDLLHITGEGLLAAVDGRVAWSPVLEWEGNLEVEEGLLDPLGAPFPGRVFGSLSGSGTLHEGHLVTELTIPRFSYEHADRRVELQAEGGTAGDTVSVEALQVRSGSNLFQAQGRLAEEWDVAWELDAPNLAVGAALAGTASGSGGVQGPRLRPRTWAELTADGLELPGLALDSLEASLDVDLADRTVSRVQVGLVGAGGGGPSVTARVRGEGRMSNHALEVDATSGEGESIGLALAGALVLPPASEASVGSTEREEDLPRWGGEVTRLELNHTVAGRWGLQEGAELTVSRSDAVLDRLCLESDPAAACLSGRWEEDAGGDADFHLHALSLDRFAEHLPDDLQVNGVTSATAVVRLDAEGSLSGKVDAAMEEGRLQYRMATGAEEVREVERSHLSAELDSDGRFTGVGELLFTDGSGVDGAWEASSFLRDRAGPLSGHFNAELHDRGLLAALSEELWNTSGVLRAGILLDGTTEAPHLSGELSLADAALEVPGLGVSVEEVSLAARDAGGQEWTLEGGARSGEGRVELSGLARLPRPDRPGTVFLQAIGNDFRVADNSLARVEVSPALQLLAGSEGVTVNGSVTIPRASITPGDMEGMTTTSPDVMVVGEEVEDRAGPAVAPYLRARLRVIMGDSVHFDGFGVTGRVSGAVTLVEEPGRLTTGQGEISLLDGEYVAARQRLTIERGRLIYSDRPLEDPGLDVRVTRTTRDVLAGMEVRGTAQEPEITVFSDPPMPQADAMAYLLIGRPVRGAGERDGDLMGQVATSMGLAGGSALLGRIGPSLGLAEARIDRGESIADAALVVGTYFTPRLFLSYGMGLFDEEASVFRLRYELTDRWIFRTERGRELGADFLFSREW